MREIFIQLSKPPTNKPDTGNIFMRLVQYEDVNQGRCVGMVDGNELVRLAGFTGVRDLALAAIRAGVTIENLVSNSLSTTRDDYASVEASGRLLAPIDHDDPCRLIITGTGLTHIGSAALRSNMHGQEPSEGQTDAAKLFRAGIEGGKPALGKVGIEPEWFHKGTGRQALATGQTIRFDAHAQSLAEEAEIAGVYIIGDDGTPYRIGFTLANDVSDHVLERQNYMYIASSKLHPCPLGPELLLGDLPDQVNGTISVLRDETVLWSGAFASGQANMSHSIANLEHHHFKHSASRHPGDVHVHVFGCDATSGVAGLSLKDGDVFEISAPAFGRPLKNPIARKVKLEQVSLGATAL